MNQGGDDRYVPMTSVSSGKLREARSDVFYYTNQIVNIIFIKTKDNWVLVDAGMPKSGPEILKVAEEKFGVNTPPTCIIITHGHFDHIGGIVYLLEKWSVPVYAHKLEFPFLTGEQDYPTPDVTVEGGLLAKISAIYPNEAINIKPALLPLPDDGSIPGLSDWKWIHAPGHTPGQVLVYRESDGTLLTTDALVTVKQDSFYRVLMQSEEIHGPPVYFTLDWKLAKQTVQNIQALHPQLIIPGHGSAMQGDKLSSGLKKLAENFEELAVPSHGKFLKEGDKCCH